MIDTKEFEKLISDLVQNKIDQMFDQHTTDAIAKQLNFHIQEKTNSTITEAVNHVIQKTNLIEQLQTQLLQKLEHPIQEQINSEVRHSVNSAVAHANVGSVLNERLDNYLDRVLQDHSKTGMIQHSAINWDGFELDASRISTGTFKRLRSRGIDDVASKVVLTVMDDQVVVENQLTTKNMRVTGTLEATSAVVTGNLTVNGNIIVNSDQFYKQIASVADDRINQFNSQGVDIQGRAVVDGAVSLLTQNQLGSSVVKSNLRELGRLKQLDVTGESVLANGTLTASNKKVGINTENPTGALSVWDEETEFTVRKHKQNQVYIGSTRNCSIAIGINQQPVMIVEPTKTHVKSIVLDGVVLRVSNDVPSGSGTPGEIVIMKDFDPQKPWAYQCLGSNTWVPLER